MHEKNNQILLKEKIYDIFLGILLLMCFWKDDNDIRMLRMS